MPQGRSQDIDFWIQSSGSWKTCSGIDIESRGVSRVSAEATAAADVGVVEGNRIHVVHSYNLLETLNAAYSSIMTG